MQRSNWRLPLPALAGVAYTMSCRVHLADLVWDLVPQSASPRAEPSLMRPALVSSRATALMPAHDGGHCSRQARHRLADTDTVSPSSRASCSPSRPLFSHSRRCCVRHQIAIQTSCVTWRRALCRCYGSAIGLSLMGFRMWNARDRRRGGIRREEDIFTASPPEHSPPQVRLSVSPSPPLADPHGVVLAR